MGECSARPISSKYIKETTFSWLLLNCNWVKVLLALVKTFSTPFDVLAKEPWYEWIIIFGKSLKKLFSETEPCIDLFINCILKDLLQPGLPTINIGTLQLIEINKEKIFSNKALFCAIPLSNLILFTMNFCSLNGKSKKDCNLNWLYFFNIPFIFCSNSFLCSLIVIFK